MHLFIKCHPVRLQSLPTRKKGREKSKTNCVLRIFFTCGNLVKSGSVLGNLSPSVPEMGRRKEQEALFFLQPAIYLHFILLGALRHHQTSPSNVSFCGRLESREVIRGQMAVKTGPCSQSRRISPPPPLPAPAAPAGPSISLWSSGVVSM